MGCTSCTSYAKKCPCRALCVYKQKADACGSNVVLGRALPTVLWVLSQGYYPRAQSPVTELQRARSTRKELSSESMDSDSETGAGGLRADSDKRRTGWTPEVRAWR